MSLAPSSPRNSTDQRRAAQKETTKSVVGRCGKKLQPARHDHLRPNGHQTTPTLPRPRRRVFDHAATPKLQFCRLRSSMIWAAARRDGGWGGATKNGLGRYVLGDLAKVTNGHKSKHAFVSCYRDPSRHICHMSSFFQAIAGNQSPETDHTSSFGYLIPK